MPYASLSQAIKLKVKRACTFISRFEEILAHEAHKRGMDGVVCGHIHKAEQRDIDLGESGGAAIQYLNCGDWVESCTALVEHADGRLEIIDGIQAVEALKARRKAKAAGKGGDASEAADAFEPIEDDDDTLDIDEDLPELVPADRALFGAFRPIFLNPTDRRDVDTLSRPATASHPRHDAAPPSPPRPGESQP